MARRKSVATRRTWIIRAAISVGVGLVLGFASGATAVRVLQPAATAGADAVVADTSRKARRGPNAAATEETPPATEAAPSTNGILVPKLVGLEEGAARDAITRAGFTVGTVMFKSSAAPAGTVLSTFPMPGESVPLPATVNLILSDGRPRPDSLAGTAAANPRPPVDHPAP